MALNIKSGQIVLSVAGRDKGRYFVVCGVIDDNYVYMCDGELRKIKSPKKKNIKHLRPLPVVIEELAERMASRKATDNEVCKTLKTFISRPDLWK